jgi:hypothetical protein
VLERIRRASGGVDRRGLGALRRQGDRHRSGAWRAVRALLHVGVALADRAGTLLDPGRHLFASRLRHLLGLGVDQLVLAGRALVADDLADPCAGLLDLGLGGGRSSIAATTWCWA